MINNNLGVRIPPACVVKLSDVTLQKKESAVSVSSSVSTELSTLARQLAESAVRAEERERSLTRKELTAEAQRIGEYIFGIDYEAATPKYHDQHPDTADPELLERARLATEYVENPMEHGRKLKNPFAGLSRPQLNLIVYDEAGPYTINERYAAFLEVCNLETQWNRQVMRIYDFEAAEAISNRPRFCTEVLAHYRSLPLIEQVQYHHNYEARLEARINEKPEKTQRSDKPLTLFEVLELIARSKKRADAMRSAAEAKATVHADSGLSASFKKNN